VQGYSDGSETAWIEPTVAGQDEPEHPAPVLTLAADTAAAPTAEPAAGDHEHASATDEPGALALFVAFLALMAGIAGVVLGVRANRRTVSS
jgi:hypothetical protein